MGLSKHYPYTFVVDKEKRVLSAISDITLKTVPEVYGVSIAHKPYLKEVLHKKAGTSDGWHTLKGFLVYTLNGEVKKIMTLEGEPAQAITRKYKAPTEITTFTVLRSAVNRGTVILKGVNDNEEN